MRGGERLGAAGFEAEASVSRERALPVTIWRRISASDAAAARTGRRTHRLDLTMVTAQISLRAPTPTSIAIRLVQYQKVTRRIAEAVERAARGTAPGGEWTSHLARNDNASKRLDISAVEVAGVEGQAA